MQPTGTKMHVMYTETPWLPRLHDMGFGARCNHHHPTSATGTCAMQVTGLAVSPNHPYVFSCGLDKMVKCWDMEYNKVPSIGLSSLRG